MTRTRLATTRREILAMSTQRREMLAMVIKRREMLAMVTKRREMLAMTVLAAMEGLAARGSRSGLSSGRAPASMPPRRLLPDMGWGRAWVKCAV